MAIDRLFVFGDSFSDIGALATATTFNPWSFHVIKALGLNPVSRYFNANGSGSTQSTVYAVRGASIIGNGAVGNQYSVSNQILQAATDNPIFYPNDTAIVFTGVNDVGVDGLTNIYVAGGSNAKSLAAANLQMIDSVRILGTSIESLIKNGLKHLLFVNTIPQEITPRRTGTPVNIPACISLEGTFNTALRTLANGTGFPVCDIFKAWYRWFQNFQSYGFSNVTTIFPVSPVVGVDIANQYFFNDDLHPGPQTQRLMSKVILESLLGATGYNPSEEYALTTVRSIAQTL